LPNLGRHPKNKKQQKKTTIIWTKALYKNNYSNYYIRYLTQIFWYKHTSNWSKPFERTEKYKPHCFN